MNKIPAALLLVAFLVSLAQPDDAHAFGRRRRKATAPAVTYHVLPSAQLVRTDEGLRFPHDTDSNSPMFWADGVLHVFNSSQHPWISTGSSIRDLGPPEPIRFDDVLNGGRWMEAVWREADGTIYGWYHHEPAGVCSGPGLTSPLIGAAKSTDNGRTWNDLGIILKAPPGPNECETTANHSFEGGNGDLSVMLDAAREYLYLFYSNYKGPVGEQGVAVARMRWADRDAPVGKIRKWREGQWSEPGLGGRLSPTFGADQRMQEPDALFYWGASIHWNIDLRKYVILLNRATGPGWVSEGLYVSFSDELADPLSWTAPQKVLDGGLWYPQVVGDASIEGTDKLAGREALFFNAGISNYRIVFRPPGFW